MADEIQDDGPGPTGSSYFSAATTTLQRPSHVNGQQSSRPQNQPGLDRQSGPSTSSGTGIVQPKPQALPRRTGPAAIIVSPRQKGNPVLDKIKSMPWEYGDIPADYVLGVTTCALFLSLKYHCLHPEYIYGRIKGLQGKYALRIVLCMVDIKNHEQSLKELSKTSVINNVTIVLCWSAAEGGRYLELFKTYENAAPTSIKQHQSTAYSDRMVDFITTPRSVNKTDAVSLVSQFGTIRTAVNARHEEVATITGWGEKKVQQWCNSVSEPFRIQRTGRRHLNLENLVASQPALRVPALSRDVTEAEGEVPSHSIPPFRTRATPADADLRSSIRPADDLSTGADNEALPSALASTSLSAAMTEPNTPNAPIAGGKKRKPNDDPVNDGVMAALSKLRKAG